MRSKDFEQQVRYIKTQVLSQEGLRSYNKCCAPPSCGYITRVKKCKKMCFNIYPKIFDLKELSNPIQAPTEFKGAYG